MENITYCSNDECKNKYKCERYRDSLKGKEFWLDKFDPKTCPENDENFKKND